jgi:hypothetical protein
MVLGNSNPDFQYNISADNNTGLDTIKMSNLRTSLSYRLGVMASLTTHSNLQTSVFRISKLRMTTVAHLLPSGAQEPEHMVSISVHTFSLHNLLNDSRRSRML